MSLTCRAGYPGGLVETPYMKMLKEKPEEVIRRFFCTRRAVLLVTLLQSCFWDASEEQLEERKDETAEGFPYQRAPTPCGRTDDSPSRLVRGTRSTIHPVLSLASIASSLSRVRSSHSRADLGLQTRSPWLEPKEAVQVAEFCQNFVLILTCMYRKWRRKESLSLTMKEIPSRSWLIIMVSSTWLVE